MRVQSSESKGKQQAREEKTSSAYSKKAYKTTLIEKRIASDFSGFAVHEYQNQWRGIITSERGRSEIPSGIMFD